MIYDKNIKVYITPLEKDLFYNTFGVCITTIQFTLMLTITLVQWFITLSIRLHIRTFSGNEF